MNDEFLHSVNEYKVFDPLLLSIIIIILFSLQNNDILNKCNSREKKTIKIEYKYVNCKRQNLLKKMWESKRLEHSRHVCILRHRRRSSIIMRIHCIFFLPYSLCIEHGAQATASADHDSIIVFPFNAIIAFEDFDFHFPFSFVIPSIFFSSPIFSSSMLARAYSH